MHRQDRQVESHRDGRLPGKLDRTYAAIKGRTPKARVVVLGYPRIFASGPAPPD
ncbi:hypothetical protein [Amycolatopsis minnesotensis]|uniref:hypothetical protein n=1 Tax=Amycolatopsis minnesotensis TaxID=337894 RepID=UPI0031DF8B5B